MRQVGHVCAQGRGMNMRQVGACMCARSGMYVLQVGHVCAQGRDMCVRKVGTCVCAR